MKVPKDQSGSFFFKFKKRLSGRFDRGLFDGHSLSNFQREGNNIRQPEALLVQ